MSKSSRRAILAEEQRALDHIYRCIDEGRKRNEAIARPQWSQNDPESGTTFIHELPRELQDAYADLGPNALVVMRVDIDDPEQPGVETFRIGRRAVTDPRTGERLLVNWAAPRAIAWQLAAAGKPGEIRLRRRLRCNENRTIVQFTDDIKHRGPSRGPTRPGPTASAEPPRENSARPVGAAEKSSPQKPSAARETPKTPVSRRGQSVSSTGSPHAPGSPGSAKASAAAAPEERDSSAIPAVSFLPPVPAAQEHRAGHTGPSAPEVLEEPGDESEENEPTPRDFLLEDMNRARDGRMRDIVETIEREQLLLVADERPGVLIVQGGPGTGKSAVGLHRVTWLVEPDRDSGLKAEDILVVGPNDDFLTYVGEVLPRLGTRGATVLSLGRLWADEASGVDDAPARKVKSDERMADVLRRAVAGTVRLDLLDSGKIPSLVVAYDGLRLRVSREDVAAIVRAAAGADGPFEARRRAAIDNLVDALLTDYRRLRPVSPLPENARRDLERGSAFLKVVRALWPEPAAPRILRQLSASRKALAAAAEGILSEDEQQVLLRPQNRPFTPEDVVLLDELRFLLTREVPRTYKHLIVDEAQDLTPMQARALARRCPSGAMTVLGDLAQATGPHTYPGWERLGRILAGGDGWSVAELTEGYRVPREVMEFAAPLAAFVAPGVTAPTAVRPAGGDALRKIPANPWQLLDTAIDEALKLTGTDGRQSRSIALVVPDDADWMGEVRQRLAKAQETASEHAQAIRILPAALTKGLEFDHVIVLEPASIAEQGPTGLHQLYVALTRCTQTLTVVHTKPLPPELTPAPEPPPAAPETAASTPAAPKAGPAPAKAPVPKPAPPRSRPVCRRFHADGTRCTNPTVQPDGWCRQPGCEGFRTSEPFGPPVARRLPVPYGADWDTRLDLPADRASEIRVSRNARVQFTERHGGSESDAAVEITAMLEVFLTEGRHIRQQDGYWLLDKDGYRLVLSPDVAVITSYRTVHHDRSFAQFAAGVKSRVSRKELPITRPALGQRPGLLPELPASAVDRIDPAALYLGESVASAFDRLLPELSTLDDTRFEERLRARLAADLSERPVAALDAYFLVVGEEISWAVRRDGGTVRFVRENGEAEAKLLPILLTNGGRLPAHLTDPGMIGTRITGTVRFDDSGTALLDTDALPAGQAVLRLRPAATPPQPGSKVTGWVSRQMPTHVLIDLTDHGRLPVSAAMRERYLAALTSLDDAEPASAADRLAELAGMASRCLSHDQADWFTVWELLGRPSPFALKSLRTFAHDARTAHLSGDEAALRAVQDRYLASAWPQLLREAHSALLTAAEPDQRTPGAAAPDLDEPRNQPDEDFTTALIERAKADRADDVHERLRHELMVHLFRAGAAPTDDLPVDILREEDASTVLYEVLGETPTDYTALRDGAVRLLEIKESLGLADCHLFLVLPAEPPASASVARISRLFGVSVFWRSDDGWAGDAVDLALASGSAS